MQVTAKHDERRAHPRQYGTARQLRITVDGQQILTEIWSVGGFRSYRLFRLNKKDRFTGHVKIPDRATEIKFNWL